MIKILRWVLAAIFLIGCGDDVVPKEVIEVVTELQGDLFETPEDTTLVLNPIANDVIPLDSFEWDFVVPENAEVVRVGEELHFTPVTDFNGPIEFAYSVQIEEVEYVGAITVVVTPVNDAPVPVSKYVGTNQDSDVVFNAIDNDFDIEEDELKLIWVESPTLGGATVRCTEEGVCVYTPAPGFRGYDSFAYEITDGISSTKGVIEVNVKGDNFAPIATASKLTTNEDVKKKGQLLAEDQDEIDALRYYIVSEPSFGAVSITTETGQYIYHPQKNFNGKDSFWFRAFDGFAYSTTKMVEVAVTPVNDPPTSNARTASTQENVPVEIFALANDVDGDSITIRILSNPDGTLEELENGRWTYTPPFGFSGVDQLEYEAFDGELTSSAAVISIQVEKINDLPIGESIFVDVDEDEVGSWSTASYDPDGDPPTYRSSYRRN